MSMAKRDAVAFAVIIILVALLTFRGAIFHPTAAVVEDITNVPASGVHDISNSVAGGEQPEIISLPATGAATGEGEIASLPVTGAATGDGGEVHAESAGSWVSNSSIVAGLFSVGAPGTIWTTPTVYNDAGTWKLIAGNYTGNYNGFQWNGTSWVSNSSIVAGLGNTGVSAIATVYNDAGTWKLITGNSGGTYSGFRWNGTSWVSNSSIITGLAAVYYESAPIVYNDAGVWKIIVGPYDNAYGAFQWNGTSWVINSSIVTGLSHSGTYVKPTIYNDGTWRIIVGYDGGTFDGFQWNGTSWVSNSSIVSGLGDIGTHSTPIVYNDAGVWKLISGEWYGGFYGFQWTIPPTTISNCYAMNSPGSYVLNQSISNAVGTCMNITANNVTLDCQGNTIDGDGIGPDNGISNKAGYDNIIIKNCIITGFTYGVLFNYSSNSQMMNNVANSNSQTGFEFWNSTNNIFINNTANSQSVGYGFVLIFSSSNNVLVNNTANSNGDYGILVTEGSSYNNLTNNMLSNPNQEGIVVSWDSQYNRLVNNTLSSNAAGIWIGYNSGGTVIENNTISSSTGNGIVIQENSGSNVLTGNRISTSTAGIAISTNSNTMTGNNISHSPTGISVSGSGNSFANTIITNSSTYIAIGATITITNTTFNESDGSARFVSGISLPSTAITRSRLNISTNRIYLNATALPGLNTSAELTLRNLSFPDPVLLVDSEDDGTFIVCNAPKCNKLSYSAGTLIFNVSNWTTYSSTQNMSGCPCTINSPGTYILTQGINNSGIAINASNVVIEGQGNIIMGNSTGYGINLSGFNNITLRNIRVGNFSIGMKITNSNGNLFDNMTFTGNGINAWFDPNNTVIQNSVFAGGQYGLILTDSNNNTLRNNVFANNTQVGALVNGTSTNNTFFNNTAYNNSLGIELNGSGVTLNNLVGNNASSNTLYGLYLESGTNNNLINNTANSNTQQGIRLYFSSNNNLTNNTASANGLGISLIGSSNNRLASNNASGPSQGRGFYLAYYLGTGSDNNVLISNIANSNDGDGFDIAGSSNNSFTNNNATGNVQWDFYSWSIALNNTVINLTTQLNRVSFTSKDIGFKGLTTAPAGPANYASIGKYASATNTSANSWMFLNFSYSDSDWNTTGIVNESTLSVWKNNGSWIQSGWNGTRVLDTVNNIVGVNITTFGSTFAPFGAAATVGNLSCTIRYGAPGACSANETDVMHMSNLTNAHSELPNGTAYNYTICCKDADGVKTILNNTGSIFLRLSNWTNAHAEEPSRSAYTYLAYIGTTANPIACTHRHVSGDCSLYNETCLLTMSEDTNAHVANCAPSDPVTYNSTVCCQFTQLGQAQLLRIDNYVAPDPINGLRWDNTNNAYTVAYLNHTTANLTCRWSENNTGYASMTNSCTSVNYNITCNITGALEGKYTVENDSDYHVACRDNATGYEQTAADNTRIPFGVDYTGPTSTIQMVSGTWFNRNITILTANDTDVLSGIDDCYYNVTNGGAPSINTTLRLENATYYSQVNPIPIITVGPAANCSTQGINACAVKAWCVDWANNTGT